MNRVHALTLPTTMTLLRKWPNLLGGFPQLSRPPRFYFPVYERSRRFCYGFLDFQRSSYYLFICQCVKQQMAKDTSCHEKSLFLVLFWDRLLCFDDTTDARLIFLPFWKFDYETSTPSVIIGLSPRCWSSLQTVMRPSHCSTRETLFEHNSQKNIFSQSRL